MSAGRLSARQREALALFDRRPGRWWSADEVGAALGTAREGASVTVASLVRRGLVLRELHRGRVRWRRAS